MAEPVTVAIAAAIATGAVTKVTEYATEGTVDTFKSLCRAVFARFRSEPEAQEALDEARLDTGDTEVLTVVAEHLERAEREDPEIGRLMGDLRSTVSQEGAGSVSNQIHGSVSGNARVYQGRDFHGDIRL
ncbi:hypothetical protein [Nocardiopsis oceani]